MKEKIKNFAKRVNNDELVKGSLTLFFLLNLFNLINYLFHFSMARLLGPVDYGILAVLMSIVYIMDIPVESIQTLISRYTSKFSIKKENGKIKGLLVKSFKKGIFLSIFLFLLYIPVSLFLSFFLKIKADLIIFTGVLFFGIFLLPVTRGIMQGMKKFKALGISSIIEASLRLFVALILVFLGLKVYGAIGGLVFSALASLIISFLFIKEITSSKKEKVKIEGIYSYSFPVMITVLSIMLIASLDIIFAKIFFSPETAGKYAVASMLGKIIFFGTSAIGKAMFPLTSEGFDKGKKTKKLFKKAFFLVALICSIALIIYWFFPSLTIQILFGKQYTDVAGILFFVGLGFSFLALSSLSLFYSLSMHKRNISLFILFAALEILLFAFFHENLIQFSIAFLTTNFIMFMASLFFAMSEK